TCWTGSSASSAVEMTNDSDSSSASLMEGSAATSFSNCSSGMSSRIFLPLASTRTGAASTSTLISTVPSPAAAGAAATFFAAGFFAAVLAALVGTNTSYENLMGGAATPGDDKTRSDMCPTSEQALTHRYGGSP